MRHLTLQLLGGFSLRLEPGRSLTLRTRKAQALLAYLAVPVGRAHPRDKLASLLWGDTGDEQARQSLRQMLVALRRALPPTKTPLLVVDRDTLALDPAAVEVDIQAFERLASGGNAKALEQAMVLYQGELLEGVRVTEEPFEDWLRAERARLRQLAIDAQTRLLALQTKANETERAVHTAARLLALDPVQEAVHRTLMRLHARQGRRGEALRQYQVCVGVLQRELRAEPEAETKHLYRELLRRTASSDPVAETSRPREAQTPTRGAGADAPALEGRLIGRDAEMTVMRRAWAAAGHGLGQVVMIVGEAGIGKSRLLAEVAAEAAKQGGRVMLGHSYESEQILPFGPYVDAFRTGRVIGDEEVFGTLNPAWRAELGRLVPEVAGSGGPAPTGDRLLVFEGVAHVIERLAMAQPAVLGLEDLHWADELSLRLLAFVARRARAARVLIVATVREDEPGTGEALHIARDELGREPHCASLTLAPLSRAETAALTQALAQKEDDDKGAAARMDQVWAISEGNPFVAVETIRALQEGSMSAVPTSVHSLPPRIREVIGRRLERLSAEGRELAAAAAVIGREFEFALLQRASGVPEREAALGVEELVRRRILQGVGEHFDITHDRIREAITTGLLAPRKKVLHGQVATALEDLYANHLEPHTTALGLHCLHAEAWDKASRYLFEAGTTARWRTAHREAAVCLKQALGALEHVPRSREAIERSIDIRIEMELAITPLPECHEALDHLLEAQRLAEEIGDHRRLGLALAFQAGERWSLADYEAALEAGERARAIGAALGDFVIKVRARSHLGRTHHSLGDFARARSIYEENLAEISRDPERESRTFNYYGLSHSRLGLMLSELGEFARGLAYLEETAKICQARENWWGLAHLLNSRAAIQLRRGDFGAAIPLLEEALEVCRSRRHFPAVVPLATANLGYGYALAGRPSEAVPLLEQALTDAKRFSAAGGEALWSLWLAEAHLLAAQLDQATAMAQRALALAVQRKERAQEAYAHRLFGEIASHDARRDVAEAERHYHLAVSLAEEMGMRPLLAHCHLGLGQLHCRLAQPDDARQHLTTAAAMYREMDMEYWLGTATALASSDERYPAAADTTPASRSLRPAD
jgi:DNA-binding SARP family transcriptional activator